MKKINEKGITLFEVLAAIALISIFCLIAIGFARYPKRSQKLLLQQGRLFANDVRSSIEISKARSKRIALLYELTEEGRGKYTIFVEAQDPANGLDESDEVIYERVLPEGVTIETLGGVDLGWGDYTELVPGEEITANGSGFNKQVTALFKYPEAPVYSGVLVRIYFSGDTDVYRSAGQDSKTFTPAPLG